MIDKRGFAYVWAGALAKQQTNLEPLMEWNSQKSISAFLYARAARDSDSCDAYAPSERHKIFSVIRSVSE